MNNTERFNFKQPQGQDFYDIEHENQNWALLESVLKAASIGEIKSVEKLPDGTTKVTYPDNTYSEYSKLNPETNMITRTDYNSSGIQINQEMEYAGNTTMGIIAMVNNAQEDTDRKYYELLSYILGFGVKQTSSVTIEPVTFTDYSNRNTIQVKAQFANGKYSIYTLGTDNAVYQTDYDSNGTAITEPYQILLTDNIYHTHVRIAQLEKKLELLTAEVGKAQTISNIRDWTISEGSITTLVGAATSVVRVASSLTAYAVAASYEFDLPSALYACSIRCAMSTLVTKSTIQVLVYSGSTLIETCTITGSSFNMANRLETFSFILNLNMARNNDKIKFVLRTLPMGSGSVPVVYFENLYIARATTAIGSSPTT